MIALVPLVIVLILAGMTPAAGGPIVAAIVAAAGITGTAATIATAAGTLALTVGASYVAQKFFAKKPTVPSGAVGGAQLDMRVDPDTPRSVLFGTCVTAGSLAYINTFGKRGDIDNAEFIQMTALADHPCEALVAAFVDGTEEAYTSVGDPEGFGFDDYRDSLFFKFYDGTQSAADALAVTKLGTATRPWTSAMVGRGMTYVRVHGKYRATLVTGIPQIRWILKGIKLYDPRKDSSVGGSGAHRFDNLATHEWTENAAVIAYNILRGIYVADSTGTRRFFYGLKKTTAAQLPLDNWFAAMNAADVAFGDGDTTKKFRAGGEVTVDTEPRDAVGELLKCCGGRLTELGGVYKLYLDAPELPALSFTDDDLVDRESAARPILPLERRINYVTGKYTSPNNWIYPKVAPAVGDAIREAEDGCRLPADLDAPMVNYGKQMQMLMRQYLARAARARKHTETLPPTAFAIEPGQCVAWTSARHGYSDKLFEVDKVEYFRNLTVSVSLTEVDPNDFDYNSADDLPESDGVFGSTIPEPKSVSEFAVEGVIDYGDLETAKPAIKLSWDPPADGDVFRVVFQIRRPSVPENVTNGESNDPESGSVVIVNGLAPLTDYEVRARFDSSSGFDSDWSIWLFVTTPDARLSREDFNAALQNLLFTYRAGIERDIKKTVDTIAALVAEIDAKGDEDKSTLRRELVRSAGEVTAAYLEAISVAVGPDSAIAQSLTQLSAAIGNVEATLTARFIVGVNPAGAIAAYELEATAEEAKAGFKLVAFDDGAGGARGEVWFEADRFFVGKTGVAGFVPLFAIDNTTTPARIVWNGDLIASGSITASKLNVAALSSITANIGTVQTGLLRSPDNKFRIDLTGGRIEVFD